MAFGLLQLAHRELKSIDLTITPLKHILRQHPDVDPSKITHMSVCDHIWAQYPYVGFGLS